MVATTAATIAVVETALFATLTVRFGVRATLVLALAFWAGAKLGTTISTTIVATITAATASATATLVLAATVSTAVAAFVTTTFAALTLILTLGRSGLTLRGGVASEEAPQPAEKARFLGFGNGGRGLRFKRALLTAWFAGLLFACAKCFAAIAGLLATGFAGAKLVACFLRLVAAGRSIIRARRPIGIASGLTVFMALRAEIRAAFAARISAGGGLFRLTADFPALRGANIFLGREDFEFSFGFYDCLGGGRFGFDRSRRGHGSDDSGWGGGSGLLCGDGRGGLLDLDWRINDRGGSGHGRERVNVFTLVVNDLDGGRLVGAGGGVFVCCGGRGGRTRAFAARQA
jgi:hypothetical protein